MQSWAIGWTSCGRVGLRRDGLADSHDGFGGREINEREKTEKSGGKEFSFRYVPA